MICVQMRVLLYAPELSLKQAQGLQIEKKSNQSYD